jgi:hypothetical protein
MSSVEKAFETQLRNIQARTGKSLEQLYALIRKSGLTKHGEIREMLKKELAMGHGDANTLVTLFLRSGGSPAAGAAPLAPASVDAAVETIYSGPKAVFRPVHDALVKAIASFGPFEIAPKKGYVSLRRKKQFAMIGPATNTRFEVGLNVKGVKATKRLVELPPGGMCAYKVALTSAREVDDELLAWIRRAYDAAGG